MFGLTLFSCGTPKGNIDRMVAIGITAKINNAQTKVISLLFLNPINSYSICYQFAILKKL
jgi:hypothetical protein